MRQLFRTFLLLVTCLSFTTANAVDRIDLSVGNISRPDCNTPFFNSFRAGLSWNTDYFQYDTSNYHRSLRFESGIGLNQTTYGDVQDIMAAPVLHYQYKNRQYPLFMEASIGATYISQTRWEIYHDLSSRLLFADRIGAGFLYEKTEVSLNFYHISNADIKPPNPGADMYLLRVSFIL